MFLLHFFFRIEAQFLMTSIYSICIFNYVEFVVQIILESVTCNLRY